MPDNFDRHCWNVVREAANSGDSDAQRWLKGEVSIRIVQINGEFTGATYGKRKHTHTRS
jgi:hypothetical protein